MTLHCRIATVAVLAGAVIVAAPPASAEWRRIDSPNFVVVGDVGARTLRDVAVQFEGFRETLTRVLTERATGTAVPTIVIVFPSDRAFTPFKPMYQGKPIASIAGLFMERRHANYIAVVANGDSEGMRIVFHEYAHLVVSNIIRQVPSWLSEGLAEYYSTYEVNAGGREAIIGRAIPHHLQRLNETSLLKLADLLTVDHESPLYNEGDRRSVFYAQSWALTHRILLGEPARSAQLLAYLDRLSTGMPPMEAWQHAFGAANMDRELQEYVRRRVFRMVQYTFTEKLAKFDVTATPLSAPDAEAFLSDFLLQQDRLDEASARLQAAAKVEPRNNRLQTMMGLIDLARNDHAAGQQRLLSIGEPMDWLLAYSAGIGIANAGENDLEAVAPKQMEVARRLFEVVRQQRGDIPNAAATLAMLELRSSAGPSAGTRTAMERARQLAPGRADYAFVHAQVLARLSEFVPARTILGPLMAGDYGPEVRESARSLMGHIVRMETAAQQRSAGERAHASTGPPALPSPDGAMPSPAPPSGFPAEPTAGTFRPIFREIQSGEKRMEAVLERIECVASGTIVFHIRTASGSARMRALSMADVEFITYRDDLSGNVSCGPLKPPLAVYLTSRSDAGKPDGQIAVAIEFLPQ